MDLYCCCCCGMLLGVVKWHVLLQEEAVQVTGHTNPQAAAEAILSRPNTATEWCVVKMGGEGAVLVTKSGEVHHAPAFKVFMYCKQLLTASSFAADAHLDCRLVCLVQERGRRRFCICVACRNPHRGLTHSNCL